MIGDTVVIGTRYFWKENDNEKVIVYMPKLDINGEWIITPEKTVYVESAGAVFAGTTGVIDGSTIRVSKKNLKVEKSEVGLNSDVVELVPVNLVKYKRVGYFPTENVRILAGGNN